MSIPSYSDSISSLHRKRIIKLPQVNSVSTFLSPVLSNIPTLIREFNLNLLTMLSESESTEANNLNEHCSESIDIDTDNENVESFNTMTGDSEKGFLTSFQKVFNENEKNESQKSGKNKTKLPNITTTSETEGNRYFLTSTNRETTKTQFTNNIKNTNNNNNNKKAAS